MYVKRTCRICKIQRSVNSHRICQRCEPAWRERIEKKKVLTARLSAAFDVLAEEHGENCMICDAEPRKRRMNVDHSHRTGEIRGLLCYMCNYGLRWFRDNPELLRSAASYLERSGS